MQRLSPATCTQLDALLTLAPDDTDDPAPDPSSAPSRVLLHELCVDPGRATLDNLFCEITKLEQVRALGLPRAQILGSRGGLLRAD